MAEDRQAEVRRELARTDSADAEGVALCWRRRALCPLEAECLPLVLEQYRQTRHWQGRASQVYQATGFAPYHEAAVELGIEALTDRSLNVRYRACGLLAYGGHAEAVPYLTRLAREGDERTARYARAALEAVASRDMSRFLAQDEPGRRFAFLPNPGPMRAPWPAFAQEFDAAARGWLRGLRLETQSVFGHDAYYRRAGDVWFHAYWEAWDVLWLFALGTREELSRNEWKYALPRGGRKGEEIPQRFEYDKQWRLVCERRIEEVGPVVEEAVRRALESSPPSAMGGLRGGAP
jgi:hypothetical protein